MRLIDADQMAAEESEAYMNASLLIKDNVNSGINYVVHTKIQRLIADKPAVERKDNDDVRDQVRDQEEFRCVVRK